MGQEAVLAGWPGNCLTLKSCDGFRSCHLRTLMAKDGYENKVQMDGTLLKVSFWQNLVSAIILVLHVDTFD